MTCSPYAGRREGASYALIVPPACGVACILLLPESFQFDGASSFHCFHKSRELIESTLQRSGASRCLACTRIAHTPRDQTGGWSYKTIPPKVARLVSGCRPRVAGPRRASSLPLDEDGQGDLSQSSFRRCDCHRASYRCTASPMASSRAEP
jgi:hypothetical protein